MKIIRIFEPFTNKALLAIGMCFSWLLYAILFVYTKQDPIIPINTGHAFALCLIISPGVFLSYLIITSFGIWETVFTTLLWFIAAIALTLYLCVIDKFSVLAGMHEPKDFVRIVIILSFFHMALQIVVGHLIFPVAIKYKKNKSNYWKI
ncbi:MAG: hypothetical protein HF981_25310 [Desulfobacteraceae bacterium]|nr:hypothetical protein [Desulfobacteraceae bacterium]MBC2753736.1 hypothetical protein [Desulfobacteraceae bacterium]